MRVELNQDEVKSLLNLETSVNEGSPNRTTFSGSSSPSFHPQLSRRRVQLPIIELPRGISQSQTSPDNIFASLGLAEDQIIVHPDVLPYLRSRFARMYRESTEYIEAAATASPRVFLIFSENAPKAFIKLSYPPTLGRFPSPLHQDAVLRSVEISSYISSVIETFESDDSISWWNEDEYRMADVLNNPNVNGMLAMIGRPLQLTSNGKARDLRNIVPLFSLQGFEETDSGLTPFLRRLATGVEMSVDEYSFVSIISPLIQTAVALARRFGIILEMHAQNFLFALDDGASRPTLIIRDALAITLDHANHPEKFHCLQSYRKDIKRGDHNAASRVASVNLDHMMWAYCIGPLLEAVRCSGGDDAWLLQQTRELMSSSSQGSLLPEGFWWRRTLNYPMSGQWINDERVNGMPPLRNTYVKKG
jgi:hypothetical protein